MTWLALLLYLLSLGTLAATALVPFRPIGRYFFTFHATLALVPAVVGVLVHRPWERLGEGPFADRLAAGGALLYGFMVLLQNGLVRAARDRLRTDLLLLPVCTGVLFVSAAAFTGAEYGVGAALLAAAHSLTAAAVLGTALVAMTTGHWYLSNAKLPFEILERLCRFLVAALAAKLAVSGTYAAWRFGEYLRLEGFYIMVMAVRTGAGLVMAMVLALMSLSCAKRHANQSATGILYVAVVFVLIGETMSLYLSLGRGTPI